MDGTDNKTGNGKRQLQHESLQDCGSIVEYLHAIAKGFETGTLSLETNGQELELEPKGLLRFTVRAKRGQYRTGLVVKMSWREDRDGSDDPTATLQINPASA